MFGGLFVMLLVKYLSRWTSISSAERLHRCHRWLLGVQEAADTILSGDSLVSKIFVRLASTAVDNNQSAVFTRLDHNFCATH